VSEINSAAHQGTVRVVEFAPFPQNSVLQYSVFDERQSVSDICKRIISFCLNDKKAAISLQLRSKTLIFYYMPSNHID